MNILDNGLLKCSVCGASNYMNLIRHIRCCHKMTIPEYLSKYPDDLIYTSDMQKSFSKGGYNANKSMKENGLDFSERSRKARATELKNDPDAYYKRNHNLMENVPGFVERATNRILKAFPEYKKHPHEHNGVIIYFKSSWELMFAKFLEKLGFNYLYEGVTISYYSEYEKRKRKYFPDFYIPDKKLLIEIKPKCYVDDIIVQEKAKACIDHNYKFKFITEDELWNLTEDLLDG